jgi:hypothetical protein
VIDNLPKNVGAYVGYLLLAVVIGCLQEVHREIGNGSGLDPAAGQPHPGQARQPHCRDPRRTPRADCRRSFDSPGAVPCVGRGSLPLGVGGECPTAAGPIRPKGGLT